jgi:putative YphP/YqiW family bacilliredoxin
MLLFCHAKLFQCLIVIFVIQIYKKMMYPEYLVAPMRADLTNAGFEELLDADAVKGAVESEGTVLVMVNSVCGCAAANARPAAKVAAGYQKRPDRLVTVFAGMEKDAVDTARNYMLPYPPSSPSMALFKDGKLVHMIERHQIEGRNAQMIADNLIHAFDQYC